MARVSAGSSYSNAGNALQPADFIRLLRTHVYWWAVPAVVCALVAGAYTFVASHEWKATQSLIIRPEVASVSEERLGKFADLSEMKTSQETILELAKSQFVLQATLREVGPPSSYRRPAEWPTALDVEAFRECVDMRPPGGAEFGKTEVFYLSAKRLESRPGHGARRRPLWPARTTHARPARPASPRHDRRTRTNRGDGRRRPCGTDQQTLRVRGQDWRRPGRTSQPQRRDRRPKRDFARATGD